VKANVDNENENENEDTFGNPNAEEIEKLKFLESQIQHTDSLLETVVNSLENLRKKIDAFSAPATKNVPKHLVERDQMKESLKKRA